MRGAVCLFRLWAGMYPPPLLIPLGSLHLKGKQSHLEKTSLHVMVRCSLPSLSLVRTDLLTGAREQSNDICPTPKATDT